jgi:hypothetical protein
VIAVATEAAGIGRLSGEDIVKQDEETFGVDFAARTSISSGKRRGYFLLCCALVIRKKPRFAYRRRGV